MTGYQSQPEGMQWVIDKFAAIESLLSSMSGANGLESATIVGPDGFVAYDATTGSRVQIRQGEILLWDDYDNNPYNYGRIIVDPGAGSNYFRWFPPFSDGTGSENSFTAQGRRSGTPGNVWVYSDGQITLRVQNPDATLTGRAYFGASAVDFETDGVFGLYGLPTTSATANLTLGYVGADWTVARVTSSRRYKTEIADAEIDPGDVLSWRPRTWRDRSEVDAVGDDAAEHIGFIAEEIHAETPEFVVLDAEGRPDALKYDRMVAGLHAVVKHQAEQIADLTARLNALEAE